MPITRPLSSSLQALALRWSLTLGSPFDHDDVTCSWVAPGVRASGQRVVLKIGMPHMEAEDEIAGLQFWKGDPTVLLLEYDGPLNAMLLELCEPGTSLRSEPVAEQDRIIAGLLLRLWRRPAQPHGFRHLSELIRAWCNETRKAERYWPDPPLVRQGLAVFEDLAAETKDDVLLATDLHAGNVLRAQREPWLVIDPKPFIGDPAYDATQHLINTGHFRENSKQTIAAFAQMLGVDPDRVRRWLFARAAAEPRAVWDEQSIDVARRLIS